LSARPLLLKSRPVALASVPTNQPIYVCREIMAVLGIQREGLGGRHNRLDDAKAFNKPVIGFSDNRAVVAAKAAMIEI
jgi:hypothetical protein